jgi:hypothetical protein
MNGFEINLRKLIGCITFGTIGLVHDKQILHFYLMHQTGIKMRSGWNLTGRVALVWSTASGSVRPENSAMGALLNNFVKVMPVGTGMPARTTKPKTQSRDEHRLDRALSDPPRLRGF